MSRHPKGTIYLLHFSEPFKHAAHYLGWTRDLDTRLQQHRAGQGARLVEVIVDAGLSFEVTRTWAGTRTLERRLKNRGGAGQWCPRCRAEGIHQRTPWAERKQTRRGEARHA